MNFSLLHREARDTPARQPAQTFQNGRFNSSKTREGVWFQRGMFSGASRRMAITPACYSSFQSPPVNRPHPEDVTAHIVRRHGSNSCAATPDISKHDARARRRVAAGPPRGMGGSTPARQWREGRTRPARSRGRRLLRHCDHSLFRPAPQRRSSRQAGVGQLRTNTLQPRVLAVAQGRRMAGQYANRDLTGGVMEYGSLLALFGGALLDLTPPGHATP